MKINNKLYVPSVIIILGLIGFVMLSICIDSLTDVKDSEDSPIVAPEEITVVEKEPQPTLIIIDDTDEITKDDVIEEDKLVDIINDEIVVTYLDCPLDNDIQEYIFTKCEDNELDFLLIMALIEHESVYDPTAISRTNDYGLMQINKSNHSWLSKELGITDFLDPFQNVDAGIYMIKNLHDKYGDNYHKVLMAYNMGEGGAKKQWNNNVYSSNYSRTVMSIYERMKGEYSDTIFIN